MLIKQKNIKEKIKADNKYYSISFSANTIDLKLLLNILSYYKKINKLIYKGGNTDVLFLRIGGAGKDLLKAFSRYNRILKGGLTYKEQALLKKIKKDSYVTKKYNFSDDEIKEEELFKVYLPDEQVDCYDDYDNYHHQEIYTKRIKYNKQVVKSNTIDKVLQATCDTITNFKLSSLNKKINILKDNGINHIVIFNYMIQKNEKKLKNYYRVAKKEKATYSDLQDFIKSAVFYGASHTPNNRFWREVKRELY